MRCAAEKINIVLTKAQTIVKVQKSKFVAKQNFSLFATSYQSSEIYFHDLVSVVRNAHFLEGNCAASMLKVESDTKWRQ